MKTKNGATASAQDFPWIAELPERQRTTVTQMMPLLATLTREADEMTAGNLVIRMVESQFAASKKPAAKAGLALALLRGRVAREELKQQEGGSISASEAAEKLGISKTAVLKRYREGKLLGWREARQEAVRFPVWQFTDDNVLPGLPDALAVLNEAPWMDEWGRILFFLNARRSLERKRPLDLLREGESARVVDLAKAEIE
ncbi:MAG: hypothetical protein NTW21_25375 [Verrucomicrobia bacterium]|nr:hypothetical protein [Verrucomicrobiota bacterium]